MVELYKEAERWVGPYAGIIGQMAKHFAKLDGPALRNDFDHQGSHKWRVTLALAIACVACFVAYLAASRIFLISMYYDGAMIFVTYTFVGLLLATPLYLAIRRYGSETYYFVAQISLLSNLLIAVFMVVVGTVAFTMSSGLVRDMREIQAGNGKGSPLYQAICLPLEKQISATALLTKARAAVTDDGKEAFIKEGADWEKQYPDSVIEGALWYCLYHYWPVLIFALAGLILYGVTSLWCYLASWRAFVRMHPDKYGRRSGTRHLWYAAIASFILTIVFSQISSGKTLVSSGDELKDLADNLSMQAYRIEPFCGKLDPHGLW